MNLRNILSPDPDTNPLARPSARKNMTITSLVHPPSKHSLAFILHDWDRARIRSPHQIHQHESSENVVVDLVSMISSSEQSLGTSVSASVSASTSASALASTSASTSTSIHRHTSPTSNRIQVQTRNGNTSQTEVPLSKYDTRSRTRGTRKPTTSALDVRHWHDTATQNAGPSRTTANFDLTTRRRTPAKPPASRVHQQPPQMATPDHPAPDPAESSTPVAPPTILEKRRQRRQKPYEVTERRKSTRLQDKEREEQKKKKKRKS